VCNVDYQLLPDFLRTKTEPSHFGFHHNRFVLQQEVHPRGFSRVARSVLFRSHVIKKQDEQAVKKILHVILIRDIERRPAIVSAANLACDKVKTGTNGFDESDSVTHFAFPQFYGGLGLLLRPRKWRTARFAERRNRNVEADRYDTFDVIIALDVCPAFWAAVNSRRTAFCAVLSPKFRVPMEVRSSLMAVEADFLSVVLTHEFTVKAAD
jgi:hypothetical protein